MDKLFKNTLSEELDVHESELDAKVGALRGVASKLLGVIEDYEDEEVLDLEELEATINTLRGVLDGKFVVSYSQQ